MYHITNYSKNKAKELNVIIKPSKNKNKKLDVFKDGKKNCINWINWIFRLSLIH